MCIRLLAVSLFLGAVGGRGGGEGSEDLGLFFMHEPQFGLELVEVFFFSFFFHFLYFPSHPPPQLAASYISPSSNIPVGLATTALGALCTLYPLREYREMVISHGFSHDGPLPSLLHHCFSELQRFS